MGGCLAAVSEAPGGILQRQCTPASSNVSKVASAVDIDSLDLIASPVMVLDPHGRVVHCNRTCAGLTGRAAAEFCGIHVRELFQMSGEQEHDGAVFPDNEPGCPRRFETCVPAANGERRWLLWSTSDVTDPEGRLEYVVASGIDTTPQKHLADALQEAKRELQRKEGYLRGIFEHSFEFVGLLAPDGTLLEANRSALEFAAVSRAEVVGRPFWETPWWTHDPALSERLRRGIAEAARGQFVRFEATHRRPDGRLAVVDFSLTPVRDERGDVILIVPEGRDITERKRAEEWQTFLAEAGTVLAATLDYQETLQNVASLSVRSLADCCIVDLVDESGKLRRITVAHAAAERPWFADTLERISLDRKRPHLARSVLETRRPVLLSHVEESDLDGFAQDDEHRRALHALGVRSMMAVPLQARGHVLGAVIFLASAGGRHYEPADLTLAQELADRAALAVENARLYRAAQDAIRARDDLLGVVAHDLKNPINAIRAAAGLQQRFLHAHANDTERRAVNVIIQSSERAHRLLEDLLDLRRITAGRLTLHSDRIAARTLLAECVEALRPGNSAATLQLVIAPPDELVDVWADRHRALQVFENLIGNAIKFTPAGGRITVAAKAEEREVVFRVSDTGVGIPPEMLPRLFDRFWQARSGDRRGVGLGLSIAREIVEAHGGRIWAESLPGGGSTFFFSMPSASGPLP
jgi:PAS domain S-box-containing protein